MIAAWKLWGVVRAFLSANGLAVAAVVGMCVSVASCDLKRAGTAKREAVTELKQSAQEITKNANDARKPAARPGAVERLRQRIHCRDC